MNKYFFPFILAIFCCTLSITAQPKEGTYSITPKVGFNISSLTGEAPMDVIMVNWLSLKPGEIAPLDENLYYNFLLTEHSSRFGFTGGIEMEYQFAKKWAIALEVLYGVQGAKYDDTELVDFNIRNASVSRKCIDVPITLKWYVLPRFAVRAGLQYSVLRSKLDYEVTFKKDITGDIFTNAGKIESFCNYQFAVPIGLNYEYGHLVFDARYTIGLTNLYEENVSFWNVPHPSTHSSSFAFTVGYKFPYKAS